MMWIQKPNTYYSYISFLTYI